MQFKQIDGGPSEISHFLHLPVPFSLSLTNSGYVRVKLPPKMQNKMAKMPQNAKT